MKLMLMTIGIAISLGATSSSRAAALGIPGIAREKTSAIAETRNTYQWVVTKNGTYICAKRRHDGVCIRT